MLDEESIADRGLNPRFKTENFTASHIVEETGHPCGDLIRLFALIDNGMIREISHNSHSCCMTKALMDILCERVVGKPVAELIRISRADVVRVTVGPVREGCIRLPFYLLEKLYADAQTL